MSDSRIWTVIGFLVVMGLGGSVILTAAEPLGIQRHEKAGLACGGCHNENPPRVKAPTGRCVQCHGEYPVLAAKTPRVVPNPHAPTPHSTPADMPECDTCHHIHKPSQDSCVQCHDTFNFKTP